MQTRDEVERLYQDMQTQERKFSFAFIFRAMITREILTSREVLYTNLVRIISLCFAKKMLSKIGVFLA